MGMMWRFGKCWRRAHKSIIKVYLISNSRELNPRCNKLLRQDAQIFEN